MTAIGVDMPLGGVIAKAAQLLLELTLVYLIVVTMDPLEASN